jgi:hypothetical protein
VVFDIHVLRAFVKFGVAGESNGGLIVAVEDGWLALRIPTLSIMTL